MTLKVITFYYVQQRYGSSVSQEGGQDEILLPVPSLVGDLQSLPGLGDSPTGESYALTLECSGGQSLTLQTSIHGMAAKSDSLQ